MSHQKQLLGIAMSLKKRTPYFKSGWNINVLQAFIRDGDRCVYCGRELLNQFCVACGDHLLPRRLYPQLVDSVDNLVPACTHCNRIKQEYDPSDGKGLETAITEKFV